jgi:hypothetical protein
LVASEVFPLLKNRPLCPSELVNELVLGAIAAEVVMSAASLMQIGNHSLPVRFSVS